MKILSNTLNPVIERWTDPGDYPSGAGGYPLPSYDYVECIEGYIEALLEPSDRNSISEYANEDDDQYDAMMDSWLRDNPDIIPHNIPTLTVDSWNVTKFEFATGLLTLEVGSFDMSMSIPDDDYDPEEW